MNYLKTIAVGRLTADAKTFAADGDKRALASFTVAINTAKDKTAFVECELRGDRVEKLKGYLTKGKEVMVEGMPFAGAYIAKEGGEARGTLRLFVDDIQLGAGVQQKEE